MAQVELNREQSIKALECISRTEDVLCEGCDYRKYDGLACHRIGAKNALALINSQEQKIFELENRLKECENGYEGTLFLDRCKLHDDEEKIKELSEENEAWQKQLIATEEKSGKAYYDLACEVEDLRAENERLNASCTELAQCCTKLETLYKIECKRVDTAKADTVRKMHSMLCEGRVSNDNVVIVANQIKKEMLEGSDGT